MEIRLADDGRSLLDVEKKLVEPGHLDAQQVGHDLLPRIDRVVLRNGVILVQPCQAQLIVADAQIGQDLPVELVAQRAVGVSKRGGHVQQRYLTQAVEAP